MGGYSVTTTVGSMLVLALFNLALGSLALCLSMRARDPRRSTMLTLFMAFFVIPNLGMRISWFEGGMAGSALECVQSAARGVAAWHEGYLMKVMLFGHAVPSLLVTILLSAGGDCVVHGGTGALDQDGAGTAVAVFSVAGGGCFGVGAAVCLCGVSSIDFGSASGHHEPE